MKGAIHSVFINNNKKKTKYTYYVLKLICSIKYSTEGSYYHHNEDPHSNNILFFSQLKIKTNSSSSGSWFMQWCIQSFQVVHWIYNSIYFSKTFPLSKYIGELFLDVSNRLFSVFKLSRNW